MASHLVTQDLNPSSKLPSSIADAVVVAIAESVVVAATDAVVVAAADPVVLAATCCLF